MAVPILYSTDLDRTAAYYGRLGLQVMERHDTYLVMRTGPVELHFTRRQPTSTPGQAFVRVPDAGRLWKQFRGQGVAGVGPLEDHASGLREFVVTDPDGNSIRVGSPTPEN